MREETAPGWTHAYSIVMPESELQPYPAEVKKITLLPAADPGSALAVTVLLAKPSARPVKWDAAVTEVGRISLANRGQVLLLSQTVAVPQTWLPAMERTRTEAREQAQASGLDLAAVLPVVALIMTDEEGSRLSVEISAWPVGKAG
ncbi:hypothetical protein [Actinacidiphila sp. ITFR-21]|uniref:hypothetical protein n=1 Tax=Actinacidiphila sp. ITFR-21 TaxID=3075199 RepID=UPI00288A10A0|nr:hypothetical protein [Streptomyces sp. ITFR-21]WNI16216.1 hypothetical protein RLT57_12190 [Streptomyces sp. ITFR-21]